VAEERPVTAAADGEHEQRETISFTRELGLTHAEFHRSLPAAIAHRPCRSDGDRVIVEEGTKTVTMTLGPQQQRRIASLRLPFVVVGFEFVGFTAAEFEDFMRRFERYFQRGGG
jgi:hypothetical protein